MARQRTVAEVFEARRPGIGCCDNYCDHSACDCLQTASDYAGQCPACEGSGRGRLISSEGHGANGVSVFGRCRLCNGKGFRVTLKSDATDIRLLPCECLDHILPTCPYHNAKRGTKHAGPRPFGCGIPEHDLECVGCGKKLYGRSVEDVCPYARSEQNDILPNEGGR